MGRNIEQGKIKRNYPTNYSKYKKSKFITCNVLFQLSCFRVDIYVVENGFKNKRLTVHEYSIGEKRVNLYCIIIAFITLFNK